MPDTPRGEDSSDKPVDTVTVEPIKVTAEEIGEVKDIQRLPPLPRAGYRLALMVGSLMAVVTILLIIQWWISAPSTRIPSNFSAEDADKAKALAENLKMMSETSVDRSIKLFDSIVGKVLLPVFTSLLGYIFGTRGGDGAGPSSNSK